MHHKNSFEALAANPEFGWLSENTMPALLIGLAFLILSQ